ncbi:hypothetical protein IHE45_14G090500 [Dioscorea alata]|uniref:Uncharacterized protein n=1 Tax=Dioscorea alata TaxID=55571 RepID=A0ACB7UT71_DIOAL|nr:hypothetical protein IHE45_14G090500 [Dioscorea alata]
MEEALARSAEMLRHCHGKFYSVTDSEEQLPPEKFIKPCICRVPQRIRKGAEEEFDPQLVSLGPYNFGKPNLATFEAHKYESLLHCLRRAKKDIFEIRQAVNNIVTDLYYCYDKLWHGWDINHPAQDFDFVWLMVVDGCFLVELVRATSTSGGLHSDNPVMLSLMNSYNIFDVLGDSMLLENQLPLSLFQLLDTILHPECNFKDDAQRGYSSGFFDYIELILQIREPFEPAYFKHWLDYVTTSIKITVQCRGSLGGSWKSAVEISNAGVDFVKSMERIEFKNGVLRLPPIHITHQTKRKLLNAVAYDMLRARRDDFRETPVLTEYVILMASLLKTPEDVIVLTSARIILNTLENHQAVVDLFNNISHVASGGQFANILNLEINDYCDTKWRRFRAHVKETYFRSPWAMFSLVYAIILFLFTAGQTYYTVAANYSSKDGTRPK